MGDLSPLLRAHRTSQVRETHFVGSDAYLNPAVEFVFQKLKEGHAVEVIHQFLALDFPTVRAARYPEVLRVAYNYGAAALHKDRDFVFHLHAARYETIYLRSLVMEHDRRPVPLDPAKDAPKMVGKLRTAAKALRQQEELLGLHDKRLVVEVTDSEVFLLDQGAAGTPGPRELSPRSVAGLDLSQLETAEVARLLGLLQRSRTTPLEGVQRVVVRQTKVELVAGGLVRYEEERAVTPVTLDAEWVADLPAPVLDQVADAERPIGERVDLSGVRDLRSRPLPDARSLEELHALQAAARAKAHVKDRALDRLKSLTDGQK